METESMWFNQVSVESAVPSGRRPRLGAAWVGAQAARSLGRVLKLKRETEEPNEFNLK